MNQIIIINIIIITVIWSYEVQISWAFSKLIYESNLKTS